MKADPAILEELADVHRRKKGIFRLKTAIWEFTLKCNLRCIHCGSAAGTARQNELTLEECRNVCNQLSALNCQTICLMGGEPFLREDVFDIGWAVKDLGMSLTFVSNGTLMDNYIDRIAKLEPTVVGVSLDGAEEAHERIRGQGTWDKAMHAIDLLLDHGIQTTMITAVSKINMKDLPKMRDMIKGRGINWQIQLASPFGNFKRELMLSPEEYYATALFIAKERLNRSSDDMPVVGAHCYGYSSKVLPTNPLWQGCTAGIENIGITSDGGIVGCLSMGNDRFIEGNVRERSIADIWNDPKSFPYNRRFVVEDTGENCVGCRQKKRCKGGCNSVSLSTTGKVHNDPYCFKTVEASLRS